MTLPTDRIFPVLPELKSLEESNKYLSDLNVELQDMYQEMTQNVNGTIRSSEDVDGSEWIPNLVGGTTPGTFVYSQRAGWVIRTGIITEISFDIYWTSVGGATGRLTLELPYKVIKGRLLPFFGPAISDTIDYGPGFTNFGVSPLPGTFKGTFTVSGTGLIAEFLQVQSAGRVAGQLRYIGVENE